jgi:hypothetical protein
MASKNKKLNKFIAREPEQKKADDLENVSSPMTQERAEALFTASMKSGEIGQLQFIKGKFHLDHDNPELIAAIEFLGDTDYFLQGIEASMKA